MDAHYCSNCGSRLEPDAKFCWNCGRPVHIPEQAPTPEEDVSTSQLPESPPPASPPQTSPPPLPPLTSPPPQYRPREVEAGGGTAWHRGAVTGGAIGWPMLALVGVFIVLIVVETMQGGMAEAIRAVPLVAAVVLVGSVVSYLALVRRNGGATLRGAVFNGSVVLLAAFATLLFVIS